MTSNRPFSYNIFKLKSYQNVKILVQYILN